MRIEVVESIPEYSVEDGIAIEDSAVKLALKNFRSALQSDDSLFDSKGAENGPSATGGEGSTRCAGEFLVAFRGPEQGRNRGLHLQLIEKLIELLKDAGSPDVMAVFVCLISEARREIREEVFGLRIRLEATGDSKDKAGLRWGLALAHLQQALLFTSRYLRQKTSRNKE